MMLLFKVLRNEKKSGCQTFFFYCLWLLIVVGSHSINAQNLQWALRIGGPGSDSGFRIVQDDGKNLIIAGSYHGTVDFDPGIGEEWLSSDTAPDVFVIKLDEEGNFIWVRDFGGKDLGFARGLAVDNEGNIYTTGVMQGKADFDPGPGTYTLSGKGGDDFFIQKLDAQGNFKWAMLLGDTEDDVTFSIKLDEYGQLYVAGYMNGTIDFDPGPGVMELSSLGKSAFIYKISPEGQPLWAKKIGNGNASEVRELVIDQNNDVLITGGFFGTFDVDPGTAEFELIDQGGGDSFVVKLDANGNFIWGKNFSGEKSSTGYGIAADEEGNVIVVGGFNDTLDCDPGPNEFNLFSRGNRDQFLCKLDAQGEFLWAHGFGSTGFDISDAVTVDKFGNIYHMARISGTVDVDPGAGVIAYTSHGLGDFVLARYSPNGDFNWGLSAGGVNNDFALSALIDDQGSVYLLGHFTGSTDFDPSELGNSFISFGATDIFLAKYVQEGVQGSLFNDVNRNCVWDQTEYSLRHRYGIIQPGDLIVKTNGNGKWYVDSLPVGQYSIMFDTSDYWQPTCDAVKTFEVLDPNFLTLGPRSGMATSQLCARSEISIHIFTNRRCENFTRVFVKACNAEYATGPLINAYVDIELDDFIIPTGFSMDFEPLGGNVYRVFLDDLSPGECIEFTINALLDCDAVLGTNVCARALMFPADTCMFDDVNTFTSPDPQECAMSYDNSHLIADGWCDNDTLFFLVVNEGTGSMQCSSAVKFFIDGVVLRIDSVRLNGGENRLFAFAGDGRTWRMELDQHELHRGWSMPSVTIERCGNEANWTPGLFSLFEDDDADPVIDEFCSPVIGSFDPNDKTAYPLGLGESHRILPNGEMDFIIRFQNTGNDTAYKVVIRDTLDKNFDAFTVQPGVTSHGGHFTISGPSVLEWVFNNILLPDSTTDLIGSNGFVSFSVRQKPDLPDGAILENAASIYFDYNEPVKTNTTIHLVDRGIEEPTWSVSKELSHESCFPFSLNGIEYERTGQYYQLLSGSGAPDTLLLVNATILTEIGFSDVIVEENMLMSSAILASYQWYDCMNEVNIPGQTSQSFSPVSSGEYAVIVTENGCTDTSSCFAVQIVATDDTPLSPYRIYPNPSGGDFTLELPANITGGEMHVYDLIGRPVLIQKISGNQLQHFTLHHNPGLYFVQLSIDGKTDWLRIEKLK